MIGAISACTSNKGFKQEIESTKDEIKKQRVELDTNTIQLSVSQPKSISYPELTPWLKEVGRFTVNANTSAMDAFISLAGDRPIRFDLQSTATSNLDALQASFAGSLPTVNLPPNSTLPINNLQAQSNSPEYPLVSLSGHYTLEKALDNIASQSDWTWRIDNGVIIVSDKLFKTISIASIPGKASSRFSSELKSSANSNSGVSGGSSNSNNSSGGQQDSDEYVVETDFYEDINQSITSLARQLNITANISKSTNLITLYGKPSSVRVVEQLIQSYNQHHNRAVLLDIQILSIVKNKDRAFGADITTFENIFNNASLEQVGLANGVLTLSTTQGSNAVVTALIENGATKVLNKPSVIIPNNQVLTINEDNNVVNFLQSVSRASFNSGATSNESENIEVGRIEGGTTLRVIPTIANDKVSLRLNYQQISNITFDTFATTNVSLNLPRFSNSSFDIPVVSINDGETIVLAGLSEQSDTHNQITNPVAPIFGDDRTINKSHRESVIVITARIVK